MQFAARFNPIDWGVKAARYAVLTGGNWDSVGLYLGLLVALVGVTSGFATWTFRAYQRSL